MRMGSLFSGIGGLELGLERGLKAAGVEAQTVFQVERSAFCRHILARHWPDAVRYDDVCSVGAAVLPAVDLLCGGFPCQDVSAAGLGAGIGTESAPTDRSGLWWQFARIIEETRPRWVVVENVASGARRWLPAVRRALWTRGYDSLPVGIAACEVGARHRRERVFVVARRVDPDVDSFGWASTFERSGGWQHSEGRRSKAGECASTDPDSPRLSHGQCEREDLEQTHDEPAAVGTPGEISPGFGLPARPWMVRELHGLSRPLDRAWRVAGWTPARVRTARIHGLGNAVVPDQVAPVGYMIGRVLR